MKRVELTVKGLRARPVVVPLKRPIVSKVGLFREWPMILIDLETNEGVVGRSYLEPYLKQSLRYLVAALEDLGAAADRQAGRAARPVPAGHRLAAPRRSRGPVADRGLGARHGGLGCARPGRRPAARDLSRRHDRAGSCVQQQRPVVDAARRPGRRSRGAGRRGRLHGAEDAPRPRPPGRRPRRDRRGARGRRRRRQADVRLQPGPDASAMRWCAAMRSTTRRSTGSRSRRPTTTSPAMRSWRAS